MTLFHQIVDRFKQRWVLFFLLTLVLSVLIWKFGHAISVYEYTPLQTSLSRLLVITVLWGIFALKFLRIKETAHVIASGLTAVSLENHDLFDKFDRCLSMVFKHLKKNRKVLPWYIVVGYADSGKSELIKRSGLEFPFLEEIQFAASLSATDVQVYITASGIFLDLPGSILEDKTGKQWEKFVAVLNKYGVRNNIAAVLVAYSLRDALKNDDEEKRRVYHINQCIDKLQHALGLIIPLYCVMTKADSVVGFNECFSGLTPKEKEQVWGLALDKKIEFKVDFVNAYESLVRSLNQKVRLLIQRETNPDRISLMAGFPLQMASLKPLLLKLIGRLFFNPLFKEKFDLCGVYFTSTEQNAEPVDHLFGSINARYGLAASRVDAALIPSTPYFVMDFFHRVVMANTVYQKTQYPIERRQKILLSSGLIFLVIASMVYMQLNYQKNLFALDTIGNNLQSVLSDKLTKEEKIIQFSAFEVALNTMKADFQGLPGLGFSQARDVITLINEKYHIFLMKHYAPLFASLVVNKINASQNDSYALYQALKVYLMLAEPSHRDPVFMINWSKKNLTQPWLLNDQDLNKIFKNPSYSITPDMPTVMNARNILNQYSSAEFAYSELLYTPSVFKQPFVSFDDAAVVNFRDVFSGSPAARISRFYTPAGYALFLKEAPALAANQRVMDTWVLGRDDASRINANGSIFSRMQTLYFQDYISHWDVLTKRLNILTLSSLPMVINTLNKAAGPSSPLSTVFQGIVKNTTLTGALTGNHPMLVDIYFDPLHQASINSIQTNLAEVATYLQNINTASNSDEACFNAAKLMMANSPDSPLVRLLQKANNSPEPIKHWLYGIVNDSSQLILSGASNWVNNAWKNTVYTVYQQTLSNRYPFAAGSRYSAGSADFSNFFGESGILDKFTQTYVQPFVTDSGGAIQLQQFSNQTLLLSQRALQLFQQAKQIRQIQFSPDGVKGVIQYSLKAIDMSSNIAEAQLKVGNQVVVYRHDPQQFTSIQWPPADGAAFVTLTLIDLSGRRTTITQNGDWALTQFLQTCNLQRMANTDLQYDCYIDNNSVSYIVHATSAQNPLALNSLMGFSIPKEILAQISPLLPVPSTAK